MILKQIHKLVAIVALIVGLGATTTVRGQGVQIPNPAWPLDTVIRTSVHLFTVKGDPNYKEPSTFTWKVYGGRLFFDEALTQPAGDESTVTVPGDSLNYTQLWVVWDAFPQQNYDAYVYVTEKSWSGCERPLADQGRYQGMRIKVLAPPDVWFLAGVTNTCSDNDEVIVNMALRGLPPIDLVYSIDGDTIRRRIMSTSEYVDADMDGKKDNLQIPITGFFGTKEFKKYELKLISSSSEDIIGKILTYPTHTVNVYVQPEAPVIVPSPTEVTVMHEHRFMLSSPIPDVKTYFWEIYDDAGALAYQGETADPVLPYAFKYPVGHYNLTSYYQSNNECISLTDSLLVEVFNPPTIAFADASPDVVSCSALDNVANESFEFAIEYNGARSYDFSYAVFDYNNVKQYENRLDFQSGRSVTITIPNNFVNYELPDIDRNWKVVIMSSINEEKVVVKVIDSDIVGGRDERTITIHPKPFIIDDIDFAN